MTMSINDIKVLQGSIGTRTNKACPDRSVY